MSRGSIKPRGRGYQINVRLGRDPDTGKPIRIREQFNGSRGQAEKRLTEILTEYDKGVFVPPTQLSFAEYLKKWLKDSIKPKKRARTHESYEDLCNRYIIPKLGKYKLNQLRKSHLESLYAEMVEQDLTRSVTLSHAVIHKALKDAIPEYLGRNVADDVELPKFPRKETKVMSEKDIQIALEFAKDTPFYELFYTYLFTGARRSELIALRWGDVNLEPPLPYIQINRSMEYVKGKVIYNEPKTKGSRATVDLTPSNAAILKDYKARINAARTRLKLQQLGPDDLVFCHTDTRNFGKPLTPNAVTHAWIRLIRKCGLKGVRLHDTRHSHATLLIKDGVPLDVVQQRLRHTKYSTTVDIYGHIVAGRQAKAANKFDELLMPKEPVKEQPQD